MKRILIGSLVIIGIVSIIPALTFADDSCSTCSATSPILDQYISFSNEIIQTLETIANEKQQATMQNQSTTILDRIANNLNQKGQTALTFTVLIGSIGTQLMSNSTRQELQVMTNGKPLMRDRDKLDKVDQTISHTLFDLGQAGVYISNVKDYQDRIGKTFDKYATGDGFLKKTGTPSSSASVLISALWDMNQAYKKFIAGGNTDGFDVFSQDYSDSLGITFASINYTTLVDQYSCARGFNKCDATYKNFGKNMSSIWQNSKDQTQKAVDTIKASLMRLKCTFAKQGNLQCDQGGFTDRQNDLLRSLYGIEGPMANKKGSSALANSMTRLGDSLATQVKDVKNFYIQNNNPASKVSLPRVASLDLTASDVASQQGTADLATQLNATMNDTLGASKASRQQHAFADPLVVTRNIPRVSIMVYSSINIVGNAQTQNTITQSLGKACENQCTNLPGTCNY